MKSIKHSFCELNDKDRKYFFFVVSKKIRFEIKFFYPIQSFQVIIKLLSHFQKKIKLFFVIHLLPLQVILSLQLGIRIKSTHSNRC